ncbi:MAG: hypothetical protein ACTHLZ_00955 [Tepidisphaeraceae bacterium]
MARVVFVAVCLLLVGIWIHPYMTGAFETHAPRSAAGLNGSGAPVSEVASIPQSRIDDSPIVQWKGQPGYWRLGKTQDGVWWFVSPTGRREFMNTVTTVQPFQMGREPNGIHYVSRDWNGSVGKYDGDLKAWGQKTIARVEDVGFKGLGAWCHPIFHQLNVPIARDLNVWKHYGVYDSLIFRPEWVTTADEVIGKACEPLKDNKNLTGYYTDNELDWSDATVGPSHYFDGLPMGDPNRLEVIKTIQSIWPTLDAYNAAWKAHLTSWDELARQPKLNREPEDVYSHLFSVWLEKVATYYFRVTTELVHKHDPNHLVLGVRFAGFAPKEVVRASRDYTDAQSLNYYVADGLLDPDMFKMMNQESGQPIILTEYGFHSLDGRSGNRNTFGFQAQVPDQQARGEAYALFTTRLARVPYVVGADWFQWSDEPPSGRSADGEDVDFGVVDVDDHPYQPLVDAVRQTTPRLNPLHAVSSSDNDADVFRSTFANKPTMHVMKLEKPITINGELSDWSETYRMNGIRRSQTIGIDRTNVRPPNIYMGWRDEGLYMAAEVFDSYIETVPALGRWWTRDNIEFWLSTRPVSSDQQVYNPYCHQFFYVPEFNVATGQLGTVGQWHRPGDAIADNLIPQPHIQQSTRLLPGRYVVEMFIPASVLHGWDPHNDPKLAFNLHVRNFQASLDYFWSAPKELTTQVRPDTWGNLILSSPQVAIAK